ncbi:hypothetical protein PAXRUDRAFT_12256 [Paxillus rubicundulus Ve08.2h10]|uniref:Uncharacterized protein n=1 Tax=Paxillus rubicundulus Ve08.2h10 TaxID=930991 RepID=A0A0D0DAD7_9AGAM|nr:hypothetical protein PAXRUDRAFT_12256 [Paxillus rubicundulus Ve08.2h10]
MDYPPEERLRQYSQDVAAYTLNKLQQWRASMEQESNEVERFARRSSRTHHGHVHAGSRKCSQRAATVLFPRLSTFSFPPSTSARIPFTTFLASPDICFSDLTTSASRLGFVSFPLEWALVQRRRMNGISAGLGDFGNRCEEGERAILGDGHKKPDPRDTETTYSYSLSSSYHSIRSSMSFFDPDLNTRTTPTADLHDVRRVFRALDIDGRCPDVIVLEGHTRRAPIERVTDAVASI